MSTVLDDLEYGAWQQARLGAVTASRFAEVDTQPKSKADRDAGLPSETARKYAEQLISERLTGIPADSFSNAATRWGNDNEPTAFAEAIQVIGERYGKLEHPQHERVFVPHSTEENIGCSPDALGSEVGMEIKCPYHPWNHVSTLLRGMPKNYKAQVQGTLWITGRQLYVYVSYDPRIVQQPLFIREVHRDEEYIKKLSEKVIKFRDYTEALYQQIAEEPF